jgi:nucleolar protein 12
LKPIERPRRSNPPQNEEQGEPQETRQEPEEDTPRKVEHQAVSEKSSKKRKRKEREEEEKAEDIESRYLNKVFTEIEKQEQKSAPAKRTDSAQAPPAADEDSDEDEIDPDLLQHEALTSTSDNADKTIFVSNVLVKVLTSKPHLSSFKQIFVEHGPIQSIRFRSIAFTDLIPRKVAFITKILHPQRDTLNAYIVYSNTDSVRKAVEALNGYVWEEKHLRVDSVSNPTVPLVSIFLTEGA